MREGWLKKRMGEERNGCGGNDNGGKEWLMGRVVEIRNGRKAK